MAGALTLGGMANGLLIGEIVVGPVTMTGIAQNSEALNVELKANTDFVVTLPPEAAAFAGVFTFTGATGVEVKLRTNLNSGDTGLPIPSQGWFAFPIFSGVTELKFKAASAPKAFQVINI